MLRTSALGLQVVMTFVVLAWAGTWVDDRFEVAPWGTLAGIGLGMFTLLTALLREGGALKSQAERERERSDRSSTDADPGGEPGTRDPKTDRGDR